MSNSTDNPLAPAWLDKGDNAWQLTAASLVALQSVPGLVVLYGGWVKHKWASEFPHFRTVYENEYHFDTGR